MAVINNNLDGSSFAEQCESGAASFKEDSSSTSDGTGTYLGSPDFPYHLLLHICRYLSSGDIVSSLLPVNHHLHCVLGEEAFWRGRLKRIFGSRQYFNVERQESQSSDTGVWRRRACHVDREREVYRSDEVDTEGSGSRWRRKVFQIAEDGHRVNAVHFLGGGWLVAGGTDHRVTLWDLDAALHAESGPSGISDGDQVDSARVVLHKHADWVTSLQSREGKLSSGSMDRTIKIFDVHTLPGRGRLSVAPNITLTSDRGVFCHAWQKDLLVAGFHSAVELFDIRSRSTPILSKTSDHDDLNLVWDIALVGDLVYLVSSDGALRTLDIRSRRFTNTITMPVGEHGVRLQLHDGIVCVASNAGTVRLYAADTLDLVEDLSDVLELSREHRVVAVHYNDAHVLAASAQGPVKMLEPVRHGRIIWQWRPPAGTGNFRGMDFAGDRSLAVCSTNHLWLWRPEISM